METTGRYLHVMTEQKQKAAESIDIAIWKIFDDNLKKLNNFSWQSK
jgi:hypothetical protein